MEVTCQMEIPAFLAMKATLSVPTPVHRPVSAGAACCPELLLNRGYRGIRGAAVSGNCLMRKTIPEHVGDNLLCLLVFSFSTPGLSASGHAQFLKLLEYTSHLDLPLGCLRFWLLRHVFQN